MITDVIIVYNDINQINKIKEMVNEPSPFFTFINESNRKTRKEAFTLKSHWGARKTPFVICKNNEKAIKAFYSEADDNVIESLIKYLNNE